jgi:RNA polymerase sigma-70 factor (ECF subfamily)
LKAAIRVRYVRSDGRDDPVAGHSTQESVPVVRATESFESFYRRERSGMIGLAYVLSGSRLAAEDLAQEAFIAAYRHWDEVGRLEQPAGWVRKVVANNSFSVLRRVNAETRALGRAAMGRGWAPFSELPSTSVEVWSEVRRLPHRQAQSIALYYIAGLTMPEIAETLGISKDTVNTHLRRGRSTLARRLGVGEEHT